MRETDVGAPGWELRAAACALTATMTILTTTRCVQTRCDKFGRGHWYVDSAGEPGALYMTAGIFYRESIATGRYVLAMNMARAAVAVGDLPGALLHLCSMPGLGPAKAGFTLQMLFGLSGCVDSENAKMYGVDTPKSFEGMSRQRAYQAACDYVALCDSLGGSGPMWNRWCQYIVAKPGNEKRWHGSADALSREHVDWVRATRRGLGC